MLCDKFVTHKQRGNIIHTGGTSCQTMVLNQKQMITCCRGSVFINIKITTEINAHVS